VVEESNGQTVGLRVEDQGCGIAPDDIERIFQPFRSSFKQGTGLGLATVHRIVTDAKGWIHVTSRVDAGTSMRVVLPAAQGASGADDGAAESELTGARA
jgi:signal transduction histidine kinase